MTDQIENMELRVTEILDDMLVQNCRLCKDGVYSYVKEKLGFGVGLKETHLEHKNEIKLIKFLNTMLNTSKYKILLDTVARGKSITESVINFVLKSDFS